MTNKFYKSFSGYTLEQLQIIFVHSQEVWIALNKTPLCVTPKPLAFDSYGIDYELLELPQSVHMLLQCNACIDNVLVQVGAVLATIHNFRDVQCLMHGDFVLHNLFTDGDNLFLIDAHPPEMLGFRKDILYGDGVRDIICFATSVASCIGFRKAVRHKEYIHNCYRLFVRGYLTKKKVIPVGGPRAYYLFVRDIFASRRRAGFGIKSAVLHVIGSAYWLWRFREFVHGY